jgi:hypothetical protein
VAKKPGFVDGKHYTEYVSTVRDLKRSGDLTAAERLLLRLIDATEAEARAEGWGVAPAYYEQLAILYSKQKTQEKERAILERYERQAKAPGATPGRLAERLTKVRHKMAIG